MVVVFPCQCSHCIEDLTKIFFCKYYILIYPRNNRYCRDLCTNMFKVYRSESRNITAYEPMSHGGNMGRLILEGGFKHGWSFSVLLTYSTWNSEKRKGRRAQRIQMHHKPWLSMAGAVVSCVNAAEVEFWRFLAKSVQSSKRIPHSLTMLHNELSVKKGDKSVPARKMASTSDVS